jgi:hypothetical protein
MPNRITPKRYTTPSALLAEGIDEIGRVGSIAYVLTRKGLHLMHAEWIERTGVKEREIPSEVEVVGMAAAT